MEQGQVLVSVPQLLAMQLLLEKKMLDKFIELSKVTGLLIQDVLDSGEATRVENILLREFNKEDFILPMKPSSSDGGNRRRTAVLPKEAGRQMCFVSAVGSASIGNLVSSRSTNPTACRR